MVGRKTLSGIKYRKRAGERKNNVNEIVNKTVKLDYFFLSNSSIQETSSQFDSTHSQNSMVNEETYGVEQGQQVRPRYRSNNFCLPASVKAAC